MKKHLFLLFLLLVAGTNALRASDWVLNEDQYYATHYTDHLYLEVFLADLDHSNTYCKEGTLIATNGSRSIDLLTLKYINEGDDESQTAQVRGRLLMRNAKAWFTNSQTGEVELGSSEQSFWLYKWGSDHHYMTAKIDLYYSSEMAGGDWKIYFHFKHSNDSWYDRVLRYSIGTSANLGLSDFNWRAYQIERTGVDKLTFTVPKLPDDIASKVSSIRMRQCTYNVRYTFYKQDGSSETIDKTYEASKTQQKTEDCDFPEGIGNPTRIDYRVTATHGVKDPDNWFNRQEQTESKENAFGVVPLPRAITTDYRQYDQQTVLTWTSPSKDSYLEVTPFVYRIETDEAGSPKSGQSWSKRGSLSSTNGGSMSFTDDDVTLGTYFRYRVLNVPTAWINHGISESSLNNPSEDLLSKLGSSISDVMNTAPTVSIFGLQQDTAVTDKVRLTWQYSRIATKEATVPFKVLRRTSEESEWTEFNSSVSGDASPAAGAVLAFIDESLPNSSVRYQYKVRLEMKGYRFESDVVTAGLLSGTRLTAFTATKGTHDGSVTLNWSAHQTGTDECTYFISRRYVNTAGEFMPVYTHNGANEHYSWEDNTVKSGYYYEYKIEAYEGAVPQNTLYAVGFCQSRGTVSGRVNFGSGTAVPDVRMWLRPAESDGNSVKGASQYVHGASEGIAWKADSTEAEIVFGAGKEYTIQFFVRPDAGLSEGAVLTSIPGVGQLSLGNTTTEGYELLGKQEPITTNIATVIGSYTAQDGAVLTGTMSGYRKISIADGATVCLRDVTIIGRDDNQYKWAGITCEGDATIVLEGNNTVKGFYELYPGIFVPEGKTLTITGTGSLTAEGRGLGCGIGSSYGGACGNITIANTVTSVTATKGIQGHNCIGQGWNNSSCGTITIGGTVYYDGSNYQNGGDALLAQTTYTYTGNGSWTSNNPALDLSRMRTVGTLPAGKYSLLTISRTGNQLNIQVDSSEVKTIILVNEPAVTTPFSVGGARGITSAQAFKGNLAEVRVWDHTLTEAEKELYYDRMLNGRESGLALYWPLDEGLERYAFDASYASDQPNGRHATVGNNISPSATTPAEDRLARYGVTNEQGEYLIRGIPFMGSGSGYALVPEKGIHGFNPQNRSLFISPTSLTANNIDFEDVSSFPMTGHIYYAGTNIPVEGVQFYVDGVALTKDGKVQQTGANGEYAISVPIGEHFVEAKMEGHNMVAGGRFPTEGKYNFADRVQHDFIDSTLVNFVGRVAGAKYNDTIPVGFGESKNNIGVAKITLKLNNESFSFNCQDDYITPATTDRYYASDTATIKSHAWTGSGDPANTKYIYITTDSTTGEFSAKLPPLKYVMKSVVIERNDAIEFTSLPEIDLTQAKQEKTDSIRQVTVQGDTVTNSYKYHTKKVLTYYAQPQIEVLEKKHPAGVYGIDSLVVPIDEITSDTIRHIWTRDSEGVHYLFGYPIYQMLANVEYDLHAYEAYVNRDGTAPVTDTVPLNGQELVITNEMSSDQSVIYDAPEDSTRYKAGDIYQMRDHTLVLDKNGRARLPWTVGFPNIVSPFTRQFSITLKRDNRTYEVFRMDAVVLGSLTTGNNFITKGPDKVQFILRDPYGAHSKTTLTKGTIHTVTKYYTYQRVGEHSLIVDWLGGVNITTANGMGVAVISHSDVMTDITSGIKANWKYTNKQDSIYQTTTVESISTGDHYPYIGANGDVYVGTSTNILIGMCRKVQAKKNVTTNRYEIVMEDALAMGEKASTIFAYSQYELETVMIPKWKDQRAQYLTRVATETEARNYVNTGKHPKCVTWLSPSDPHYGDSATYVFVRPEHPVMDEEDSVQWCNSQIKEWVKYICQNEEEKVKAMKEKTPSNYSIDGGTTRTFTYRQDTTSLHQTQTDYSIQAVLGWKQDWQIKNVTWIGVQTHLTTSVGGGSVSGKGDDTDSFTEWEYVLADGNRDVDLSVNIFGSENSNRGRIFSLFGGQTYNPYEPADSTHYYKPNGESLPLGNGSVRMEQPYMQIGVGNSAPGKSATLTDIPAGQSATATLYCSNMTNTHQALPFGYDVSVQENTDTTGLQILMDGVPINGRTIWTEQGSTVQKTITVRQTDESILDHEGIRIRFQSQYQPLAIYDEITVNAHFRPSSSPVKLTVTNPVINTDPTTGEGKLSLKVSDFNRQFKNLKNIGVQYRFAGNTQWTDIFTWVINKNDSTGTTFSTLPSTGDLKLTLDMSDNISYPEGTYEFRAFTTTPYDGDNIQVFSETVNVIKDMTKPRPLFTPAPANGILGIGEQLSVEFNEDIVPGYVGDKNIIITTQLNGRPIDHEVSLRLVPFGETARTINPVFLNGDFSMECWINIHEHGTILQQGAGNGSFALMTDEQGHMIVSIAGARFTSTATLPNDQWIFIAMNYKASIMQFNMLAQYGETNLRLFQNQAVEAKDIQIADYAEDNYLYLGPIDANIHNLALYNIFRDVVDAGSEKYASKDSYTYGLTNYWPMNEGHGFVAADTRHTHDFHVNSNWEIANTNYALRMDSIFGAQVDISQINTRHNDSYAIELWYDPSSTLTDTVFETTNMRLRYADTELILDYGNKSQVVGTHMNFPDILSGWHHFALNVVRGQAASFYLDGKRTAVIAETDVPLLQGATMKIARGAHLAVVDELRIWKATLSEDRLLSNMYHTIDTSDVYSRGLAAYYPFEKDSTINGVKTKGETLKNMAPKSNTGNAGDVVVTEAMLVENTPALKNAPSETRLTAAPVASERKVVINLTEAEVSARDIEGTTLNITVAEVHDLHGNMSNPIKWTAFVQQNTLKWRKDSVNIAKQYGDPYSFDVEIENRGGQTEYYTLYNMPDWLVLAEGQTTDDVQPLKTKTLRFSVNPLVPVNDYDVTIGIQGNKQILEPLRIVMKVRGEAPDWSVDPTLYDHSMTVIGQVFINGILMENRESMVAAFIDGECRGVASPEQVRGAAYVSLQVYGHDTQKQDADRTISFRIWDASKGLAYMDANIAVEGQDSTLFFHDGALVGNYDTPAIWTKSDRVEQLISVHENWNWITLGVEPETPYCDVIFADYRGWGILLKDTGSYIQSNGEQWKGNLAPEVNKMYKMKITRTPTSQHSTLNTQLSISGLHKGLWEMPVEIAKGWNWMPYTPLTTIRIGSALSGLNPQKGDVIKSQTAVSIYGEYGWEGTLPALEGGHGYLYYSTDTITKSFFYPEDVYMPNGLIGAPLRALNTQLSTLNYFTPVDKHNYPGNMTMTICLLDGEAVVDTCEIAAFVEDECRGAVQALREDGLYYLVIAGEGAGQPMEIKTYIDGGIVTIDSSLTFISDDHIGTPWEPYIIQLRRTEGIESVSGNPSSGAVYKILEDDHIVIIRNEERYDVTGKKR